MYDLFSSPLNPSLEITHKTLVAGFDLPMLVWTACSCNVMLKEHLWNTSQDHQDTNSTAGLNNYRTETGLRHSETI